MKRLIIFILLAACWRSFSQTSTATTTGYGGRKYVKVTTTGSGSVTPPQGCAWYRLILWGGSGSSGSAANSGSVGGGSAGGNVVVIDKYTITSWTSAISYSVAATQSTSGTAGNDTWFVASGTYIAKGSQPGSNSTSGAGAGATASTTGCIGDHIYKGGNGATGTASTTGGGGGSSAYDGGAGNNASTGTGGTSAGTGSTAGQNGQSANNSAGTVGTSPGGGAGGARAGNGTTRSGGAGAAGQIIYEWPTTHLGFM